MLLIYIDLIISFIIEFVNNLVNYFFLVLMTEYVMKAVMFRMICDMNINVSYSIVLSSFFCSLEHFIVFTLHCVALIIT